jgi:hypothetical protein
MAIYQHYGGRYEIKLQSRTNSHRFETLWRQPVEHEAHCRVAKA